MKKKHWDSSMRLDRIETFCAVARHMSFSKAAEEFHVAQSAISQQIKSLEDELGFPLFVRSTRRVLHGRRPELLRRLRASASGL